MIGVRAWQLNEGTDSRCPTPLGLLSFAMDRRLIASVVALVLPVAGCKEPTQTAQRPGSERAGSSAGLARIAASANFDFYLLNLSWSPEFCHSHPVAQECAAHATFVLHGLWPENNDGSYPENCSSAPGPADPSAYRNIYPDAGLLEHEWHAHGTCSGLSPDEFFATARAAYNSVKLPPRLTGLTAQISLTPGEIFDLFAQADSSLPRASLAISCGHNYLTAVEVCLDKSLHPLPCSGIRSCRANVVRIPPP